MKTKSAKYKKEIKSSSGIDGIEGYPSTEKIKDWIMSNKTANPGVPYEQLWETLAQNLKSQGVNPTNFDQQFWEVLHPEGLAGYKRIIKGGDDIFTNL